MSKGIDGTARGKYTLEFKMEAVRLVKSGQAVPVTAKILGVPTQTLGKLGTLEWQRPARGGWRQASVARANGAGAFAGRECTTAHGARHPGKGDGDGRRFATWREAMDEAMDWLNIYNHKRLCWTLG
jgi:hypothetical protein